MRGHASISRAAATEMTRYNNDTGRDPLALVTRCTSKKKVEKQESVIGLFYEIGENN